MDKWLTTKDLAEMLGLHEMTLSSWRTEGKGPAYVKVGRRVRYRLEDIQAWADANTRKST